MNLRAYVRDGVAGVRDYQLVAPSVGCVNRVVELSARSDPSLRILTHQNGCCMLAGDVAQIRGTMAGLLVNPNVRRSVLVGLGCESNQSRDIQRDAAARGADVSVIVFQETGGTSGAREAVNAHLAPLPEIERVPVAAGAIHLAVIHRDDAGALGAALAQRILAHLRAGGFTTVGPLAATIRRSSAAVGVSVPAIWATAPAERPATEVELLSIAAAQGVVLAIVIAGEASPLGSPIMPVIRIATDPEWATTSDLVLATGDADLGPLERMLEAVINGQQTLGERLGQRDFALPRIAPTM
jgi:altronate dehydratase